MNLSTYPRLGWAFSWGGVRADRWRALLISAAAALIVVICCGAASAWSMAARINERVSARNFAPARDDDVIAYERALMYDELPSGEQVLVAWWRPMPGAPPLPGVPTGAHAGWFVSPALASRLASDSLLASRYPDAEALGSAGVGRADELVAYRLLEDRHIRLPEQLTATPFEFLGDSAELEVVPIALVAITFIGVPAFGLLAGVLAVGGRRRQYRSNVLWFLGVSPRTTARLRFADGSLAALPGAALAAAAWILVAPRLTAVPVVGRPCLEGDLAIGPGMAATLALAITACTGLVASHSPFAREATRPSPVQPRTPPLRPATMSAAGVALMGLSVVAGGSAQPRVFLLGVLLTVTGMPLMIPMVLHRLGEWLACGIGDQSVAALLTGRSLSYGAVAAARSVGVLAAVAALAPVTSSWIGVARDVDRPHLRTALIPVTGLDDVSRTALADRLGLPSLALSAEPDEHGRFIAVGDCHSLAAAAREIACTRDGQLAENVPGIPPASVITMVGEPPDGFVAGSTHFPIVPGSTADHAIRAAVLNGSAPGVTIGSTAHPRESPLVAWILGAAGAAGALLAAALAVHLINHAHSTALSRQRLGAVGASHRLARRTATQEAGLHVLAAGLLGLLTGVVVAATFDLLEPAAAFPWGTAALLCCAVTGASASTAMTAWFTTPEPSEIWVERNHTGW